MRTFLKGLCIVLLCLSLLGLAWFLVLQPGLTNGEAQALKDEYTVQPLPGAFGSGEEPAGNEQTGQEQEPEAIVDLPALQAEYPDIKGWITIPGTCVDYPVLQSSADEPEYYCGAPTRASIVLPEAFSFSGTAPRKAGTPWSTDTT